MAEKTRQKRRREKTGPAGAGRAEKRPASVSTRPATPTLSFSRVNAILLGAAAATIALGFFLLAQGSMNVAPLLLAIGYCVLLPIGIIKK